MNAIATYLSINSPDRPAAWRWERAHELVRFRGCLDLCLEDDITNHVYRYLARSEGNDTDPSTESEDFSDLKDASRLYVHGQIDRFETDARLLAGQSIEEVGREVGERPSTINIYEKVFFHHRDRIDDINWVLTYLIGLGKVAAKGPEQLGVIWRLMGYFGALNILLAAMEEAELHVEHVDWNDPRYLEWIREVATRSHGCEQLAKFIVRASKRESTQ